MLTPPNPERKTFVADASACFQLDRRPRRSDDPDARNARIDTGLPIVDSREHIQSFVEAGAATLSFCRYRHLPDRNLDQIGRALSPAE